MENVLLKEPNGTEVVLADWGMSRIQLRNQLLQSRCGTLHYAAPEVVDENASYCGFKADAWSLGVLLFVLVLGRFPFDDPVPAAEIRKVNSSMNLSRLLSFFASMLGLPQRDKEERDKEERRTS